MKYFKIIISNLFIICTLYFLFACSNTYIANKEVNSEFNSDSIKTTSIRIVVSNKVRVLKFDKAFRKLFVNGNNFAKSLTTKIISAANIELPKLKINKGEISDIEFYINNSITDTSFTNKKNKYEKNLIEKYTLLITDLHINNNFQSLSADSLKKFATGSIEECIISYNATLIRNSDKKSIFNIEVHGDVPITFMQTERALNGSLSNNVIHLIGFLKDKKVNFRE